MPEPRYYYGDNLKPEERSRTMRAVHGRDTAPEIALRKALRRLGLSGYRIHDSDLAGKPDVSFRRRRLAVFVDGAYWHGRADRRRPGRSAYWDAKIERNVQRDHRNELALKDAGWRVVRLWDDEILEDPDGAAWRVARCLLARPMAEFFAGIGLVGMALEDAGFDVVFANDHDPVKRVMYGDNRDASRFVLSDVQSVSGSDIPTVDLATASFPCTDLSLAGARHGLNGKHSSTFWEFCRVIDEMGERKPNVLLIENVSGFATSDRGNDLRLALEELNRLGYYCDLIQLDARHWVPQSRVRMFIVASSRPLMSSAAWTPSELRPAPICSFALNNSHLRLQAAQLPPLPKPKATLASVVDRLSPEDGRWWSEEKTADFVASLSDIQLRRLNTLVESVTLVWRTAYRRTRRGRATWEIRADDISGCLRTARGGSSRQALVEAGNSELRIRWMTSREYAALMGVPAFDVSGVSENQALFGLGDAVCVPAVRWLGHHYLAPLANGEMTDEGTPVVASAN